MLPPEISIRSSLNELVQIVFTIVPVMLLLLLLVMAQLSTQVLLRVGVRKLEAERFRDEHADVRVGPVVGRQVLQQQHQALCGGEKGKQQERGLANYEFSINQNTQLPMLVPNGSQK